MGKRRHIDGMSGHIIEEVEFGIGASQEIHCGVISMGDLLDGVFSGKLMYLSLY
jgi:hypothetical protein